MEDNDKIQLELDAKYKSKWGFSLKSDEDLKLIAKDLYNGLIYTDRHCGENVTRVFMALLLMGPGSGKSSSSLTESRDKKIYELLEKEIEKKYYDEFLQNIGLIFEYLSEAGPRSINGCPIFMSFRYLSHAETAKMFDFYNEYKELREMVDSF